MGKKHKSIQVRQDLFIKKCDTRIQDHFIQHENTDFQIFLRFLNEILMNSKQWELVINFIKSTPSRSTTLNILNTSQ